MRYPAFFISCRIACETFSIVLTSNDSSITASGSSISDASSILFTFLSFARGTRLSNPMKFRNLATPLNCQKGRPLKNIQICLGVISVQPLAPSSSRADASRLMFCLKSTASFFFVTVEMKLSIAGIAHKGTAVGVCFSIMFRSLLCFLVT